MRTLTLDDVNTEHLWTFIKKGYLNSPKSVIPPEKPSFLWNKIPPPTPYNPKQDYPSKLLDQLRAAIKNTIEQLPSQKRIGVWLSGGIDTSVLLYLTTELIGSEHVRAYTLKFGTNNEVGYAQEIADYCNVKLTVHSMTPDDDINMTPEALLLLRQPCDHTAVLYLSKLCMKDGTTQVLSGLGIDELLGGYPIHTRTSHGEFILLERYLLRKCQDCFVYYTLSQSRKYVDVKFPFLHPELISYCQGLPANQKCRGNETKLRLRSELHKSKLIPPKNIEVGRQAGTKSGFKPDLKEWFHNGLDRWCYQNLPPEHFSFRNKLRCYRIVFGRNNWRKLRLAKTNIFLNMVEEGKFNVG